MLKEKKILIYSLFLIFTLIHRICFAQGIDNLQFKQYTSDHGLPNNIGYHLIQDPLGFMWFATDDGLAKFDGTEFKIFRTNEGLLSNFVIALSVAPDSSLWIGTWKGGINRLKNDTIYTPKIINPLQNVSFIEVTDQDILVSDNFQFIAKYSKSDSIWIDSDNLTDKLLVVSEDGKLHFLPDEEIQSSFNKYKFLNRIRTSLIAPDKLWIYGKFSGIFQYNKKNILKPIFPNIIKSDTIYYANQDTNHTYWLGGEGKIFTIHPDGTHQVIEDLPQEKIIAIKTNSRGQVFFLTGLENLESYKLYQYSLKKNEWSNLSEQIGINVPAVGIEVDLEDNLWISTRGEGVYCIPNHPFTNYNQKDGLSNLLIYGIEEDINGNIFVATQEGLAKLSEKGNFVSVHLKDNKIEPHVYNITKDSYQNIFINGYEKSIDKDYVRLIKLTNKGSSIIFEGQIYNNLFFDNQDRMWFNHAHKLYWSIKNKQDNYSELMNHAFDNKITINEIFEYKEQIGLATNHGIYFGNIDNTRQKQFIITDTLSIDDGLSSNFVNTVIPARDNGLWIGTRDGLCLLKDGKITSTYQMPDGLPAANIYKLLIDHNNLLWIGTPKGLSYFDGITFNTYNHATGLVSSDIRSLMLSSDQQLWIGTSGGISTLDITNRPKKISPPLLYIDQIMINGDQITPSNLLDVEYNESLRIVFKAITYANPGSLQYEYRLNNSNWKPIEQNYIDFDGLKYDHYDLQLRAKKINSQWSAISTLDFYVLPPLWLSNIAFVIYSFIALILVYLIATIRSKKIEKENTKLEAIIAQRTSALQKQKEEISQQAQKLKELDIVKTNFFSNVSHEFKTPLTLIMGPAEKLSSSLLDEKNQYYVNSIKKNATSLLSLINQLLDVAKLEDGKLIPVLKHQDLVLFLNNLIHSFELFAEQKNIELKFSTSSPTIFTSFDPDLLEKVFSNLISNALKFTDANGIIQVNSILHKDTIEVIVSDNGIGISDEKLPFIFDRFYQADSSSTRSFDGSGIGLSLVKELIDLHHGKLAVRSKLNQGTHFKIILPYNSTQSEIEPSNAQIFEIQNEFKDDLTKIIPPSTMQEDQNMVLIVEDNPDLRSFLNIELSEHYQVLEAVDGKKGLAAAQKHIPDLIISDIMMPQMDGFEMLSKLRTEKLTSHIPIIMLTAKNSVNNKISALQSGVNDFLSKPFNPEELLLRIKNTLITRDKIKAKFSEQINQPQISLNLDEVTVTSTDQLFVDKAIKIVENNIQNHELDVAFFSNEIGMSKSSLFRKLKALTGLSTTQFIRSIRLKRAAQLLTQQYGRVEEISNKVGFNDISFFNRSFKKQFGVSPTNYIKNTKK